VDQEGKTINEENLTGTERNQWEELFHRLSHPFPILMVDRVEEVEKEKRIKALKRVTANEFYLAGHFPGEPILPGVMTLEGLVQSALLLVVQSFSRGRLRCSLEKVDRVRFKRPIFPGDRVDFQVQLTAKDEERWKFKAQAQVGGEMAAEANLILKVNFREVGFEI
jgi:3-hydroxyacyl-[acyl-carrier-protein] dehydratase